MAFSVPVDYVGLADTALILKSSTENRTAQTAEAKDARGDFIAREVFGESATPSSEYVLATDLSKAITLGTVTTVGSDKVVLKSFSIKTAAGQAPTVSANGETIQAAGTVSSTIAAGTITCSVRHKAQILDGAFTLSGDGCSLNACDYTAECELTKATVEGEIKAHDVSGGRATVTATIVQSGATAPTITAGTDWDMTTPKSVTSPDGDYETWTVTLTKSLEGTDPVS